MTYKRNLIAGVALLVLLIGGFSWLMSVDIPAPRQEIEKELAHDQFLEN